MKFTMPINKTVATKVGHTIEFVAGVPTHVPKEAWREVQESGAVPENQVAVQVRSAPDATIVNDPEERRERIFAAFTTMIERNKRGDFGASNAPHQKVVESIVGFDMAAQERDALWVEFQNLSADGASDKSLYVQEAKQEANDADLKEKEKQAADEKIKFDAAVAAAVAAAIAEKKTAAKGKSARAGK